MVAASTSAVMILYTSFTATTSFVVFGLLKVSDGEFEGVAGGRGRMTEGFSCGGVLYGLNLC